MGPNKPDFDTCAVQLHDQLTRKLGMDQEPIAQMLEEMYDRGYSDGRDSYAPALPDRPCHCQNCDLQFMERQLKCDLGDIPNLSERLDPGGEVPIGECPKCGSLAYLVKPGDYDKIEADWLQEHVAVAMAAKYGDGSTGCQKHILDIIYSADPHTAMAAFMFKKNPVELGQAERNRAKTELYGLIYGGTEGGS